MIPTLLRFDAPLLGPVQIHAYGLAAVIALVAGWLLARRYLQQVGVESLHMYWSAVFLLPAIAIGGKVLPLIQNPVFRQQVLAELQGPRSLLGVSMAMAMPGGSLLSAALGAMAAAIVYARVYRLPILACMDAVSPGVALAIPIMRTGCLAAGCCYGTPTGLPWGITFSHPLVAARTGVPLDIALHPTQLYEAILVLGLGAILMRLAPRRLGSGEVVLALTAGYAAVRFLTEFVRGDSQVGPTVFTLTVTQLVALLLVVGSSLAWRMRHRANS